MTFNDIDLARTVMTTTYEDTYLDQETVRKAITKAEKKDQLRFTDARGQPY